MPQDPSKPLDPSSIASDLNTLTINSQKLNRFTDELTVHVEQIESIVNDLNIGLRAFVIAESLADEEHRSYHCIRLGYDKAGSEWGFTIDEFDEDARDPSNVANYQTWPFKEAPRALRLKVVDKIHELIKALAKKSDEMATQTAARAFLAKEIASSLSTPAPVQKTWGGK